MNRILGFVILMFGILHANARNEWYDVPVEIGSGVTILDELSPNVDESIIHVRVATKTKQAAVWGLIWNYKDDNNLNCALLSFPDDDKFSDIYRPRVNLTVNQIINGDVRTIYKSDVSKNVDIDGKFNSMKLEYINGTARLIVGADEGLDIGIVPFDKNGGYVALMSDRQAYCQRLQSVCNIYKGGAKSRFMDRDALLSHIEKSNDPLEAVWQYLDRDIDVKRSMLGGKYTLATVKSGDHYDIVLLDCVDINADNWPPMSIKGRLWPTIFIGNYDMHWYDSDMHLLDDDLNAQLSEDGSILTLRFPTLNSQLRFSRLGTESFDAYEFKSGS